MEKHVVNTDNITKSISTEVLANHSCFHWSLNWLQDVRLCVSEKPSPHMLRMIEPVKTKITLLKPLAYFCAAPSGLISTWKCIWITRRASGLALDLTRLKATPKVFGTVPRSLISSCECSYIWSYLQAALSRQDTAAAPTWHPDVRPPLKTENYGNAGKTREFPLLFC